LNEIFLDVKNKVISKKNIQEFISQITNKMKLYLAENKSEVVLHLKPEFLGDLKVELKLEDNKLSGKFIVDNFMSEKLIKDSISQLKVNLSNMGLEVQSFEVSVQHDRRNSDFSAIHEKINKNKIQKVLESDDNEIVEHINFNESEHINIYATLGWLAQNINIVA